MHTNQRLAFRTAIAITLSNGAALAQSSGAPSSSPPPTESTTSAAPATVSSSPPPSSEATASAASVASGPAPTAATTTTGGLPIELTSLRLMHQHGVISDAEYDAAIHDLGNTSGALGADSTTVMLGRWSTTIYGFVEADHIYDTTQSFNDLAGNGQVALPSTYAGSNSRLTFGVRNSRIGFRLAAPEVAGVRATAMLEMDFLGNQPPTATEGQFFTSPTFRIRHFNLRMQTPIVDVLIGQYWDLYGWQSVYHPNTVEIQGVVGQLYSRTPQIRISKTIRTNPVTFEIAAAAMRPPQRNSATPEGQFGLRLAANHWTGVQTIGATGTQISPASIAVTADVRRYYVDEFSASPMHGVEQIGGGVAVDAFLPVIPARDMQHAGNSLSIHGELSYSSGAADLYTGLTGGVSNPALPNPGMTTPPPTYTSDVDPGLAIYTSDGALHLVQWTSVLAGLQYYTPLLDGRVWISLNASYLTSANSSSLGSASKVRASEYWLNGNLFVSPTPAVRLGLGYSGYIDNYANGVDAVNHRLQFSAFYVF